MFCEKCGAQLPDTACFCNKCGNTIRTTAGKVSDSTMSQRKAPSFAGKDKGWLKGLAGVVLLVVLIVIVVNVVSGIRKKTSIYGTWMDANKTVAFTFSEDGNLRISGANNILGADAFGFTEEKGTIHLQAKGFAGIGVDLQYEIRDDVLHISVMGQGMTLYRSEASETENIKEKVENWAEDVIDTVQGYSLYGTWTDRDGIISFTFSEDGKLRISGMEDTLSVNLFTFSELDNGILQLKADTDNSILGMVSLNMNYKIEGDSMTVSILSQELELTKKK